MSDPNNPNNNDMVPDEHSGAKKKSFADKEHYKKNEQNNQLFNAVCYQVFIEKIKIHQSVLEFIKLKEQLAIDQSNKEKYRAVDEEFKRNISSYNEAIRGRLVSLENRIDKDLLTRLDKLINNIMAEIYQIQNHIKQLENLINEKTEELINIKKDFAEEINNIFTKDNPDINFKTEHLLLTLPNDLRHTALAARFQATINIDKEFYIKIAHLLAEKMRENKINFSDMHFAAKEAAYAILREEIAKLINSNPAIPENLREKIIDDIMEQQKVQQKIDLLIKHLENDFARQPSICNFIDKGLSKEREINTLKSEKCDLEREREVKLNEFNNLDKLLSNSTSTPHQLSETITAMEASIEASMEKVAKQDSRIIDSILIEADKYVAKLDNLKDEAEQKLSTEPTATATTTAATITTQATETVSAHDAFIQQSLEDLLKGYTTPTPDPEPTRSFRA